MQLVYSLLATSVADAGNGQFDFGGVRSNLIMTKYPTRIQTNYVACLRGRADEAPIRNDEIGLWVYTANTEEGAESDLNPTWTLSDPPEMNTEAVKQNGAFYLNIRKPIDLGISGPMTWVFELRIRSVRMPQLRFTATLGG